MGRNVFRLAVTLAAALILPVPSASAAPDCTDIATSTRLCTRGPGHTAIITSPNPAFTDPGPGWGFGTLGIPAIGLGGGGVWIGF